MVTVQKNPRSKGIAIFCGILISYASLKTLFFLYILLIAHLSLPSLLNAIAHASLPLILNLFEILIAISLLRLSNVARKVFIVYAVIFTIVSVNTSVMFSRKHVPQAIEKFKQHQVERYRQKGENPPAIPEPLAFIIVGVIINFPRVISIGIFVSGIALFTRRNIKEQFC